jgi:hypothetical protein
MLQIHHILSVAQTVVLGKAIPGFASYPHASTISHLLYFLGFVGSSSWVEVEPSIDLTYPM